MLALLTGKLGGYIAAAAIAAMLGLTIYIQHIKLDTAKANAIAQATRVSSLTGQLDEAVQKANDNAKHLEQVTNDKLKFAAELTQTKEALAIKSTNIAARVVADKEKIDVAIALKPDEPPVALSVVTALMLLREHGAAAPANSNGH